MNNQEERGMGYLVVHVTTARGAIPLEGAQVFVRRRFPEDESVRGDIYTTAVTDRSGNTERLALPAPPRDASLSPGNGKPYASYDIEVAQEGFFLHRYISIPIFDGITAIQPADMIPLPENGFPDGLTPDGELYFRTDESQDPL